MERVFLVVHGIVQDVGYRDFVRGRARANSIKGFVRNADDGSVEILAEAHDQKSVENFFRDISVSISNGPQVFSIDTNPKRLKEFANKKLSEFKII